jgi:hypothetical protein
MVNLSFYLLATAVLVPSSTVSASWLPSPGSRVSRPAGARLADTPPRVVSARAAGTPAANTAAAIAASAARRSMVAMAAHATSPNHLPRNGSGAVHRGVAVRTPAAANRSTPHPAPALSGRHRGESASTIATALGVSRATVHRVLSANAD